MAGDRSFNVPLFFGEEYALPAIAGLYHSETLSGNATLDSTYPLFSKLDPGGAHRDVTLEAEASSKGLTRMIINGADAAENLLVKDDGGSTIGTIAQNRAGLFFCNGTAWSLGCIFTIALS